MSDVNKDRENYEPYEDAYDEDYPADPAAAGAAGAAYPEDAPEERGEGSGIPLRGLAMVLVAVAILLAIWGIWALVGGEDKDGDSAAETSTAATAPAQQPAGQVPAGQPGQAGQQPAVTGAPQQIPATQAPAPADANGVVGDSQTNPSAPAQDPAQAASPAPSAPAENPSEGQNDNHNAQGQANQGQNAQEQNGRVNVLNNSTVQDLAANTSRQLEGQGNQIGEVGNLPEEQYKVNETTVFFHPGSEDRARRLAEQLGGVARPYDPNLPATTASQGDLTVVLAGAVAAPTR